MHALSSDLKSLMAARYGELRACCRDAGVTLPDDADVQPWVWKTLVASDYAFEVWQRQPSLLGAESLAWLRGEDDAVTRRRRLNLAAGDEAAAAGALRRFRHAESLRLVFRAVNNLATLDKTLADTTSLYETLLAEALAWSEQTLTTRFGRVVNAAGDVQRLVIVAFGKLGGGELNFSSDIDLVLAYAEAGTSDGRRSLDAGEYFVRLGRQLVALLSEPQANGVAARVDLRLRPFGNAGRLALPFGAMEQYYQREGRDWERYAWIKARPVAGDMVAGKQLLQILRPFVYRKYLDYTAFAGLRDMKSRIDAEVARRDLSDNLKLGPGGIREIEFMVQLVQLIRGGREPALRVRGLLPALAACEARGHVPTEQADRLRDAYCFLRRLENRVQMLRDAQTHDLPEDALSRERLAVTMGRPDWPTLEAELARHRDVVGEAFASMLVPGGGTDARVPSTQAHLWQAAEDGSLDSAELLDAGFDDAHLVRDGLRQLRASPQVRAMSRRGRARLDRLMPQLLAAARATNAPGACMQRLMRLVQAVARRSAYLALLEEQPGARKRLAEIFAASAFLAGRVIEQPLLLDDVLDPRMDQLPLKRSEIAAEITHVLGAMEERDVESDLERLNEIKASISFRLGLAFLDQRTTAGATARRLAAVAEAVVGAVLTLAEHELRERHGHLPDDRLGFAILGYGSLGGQELGFASDLDLVFVYDGARAGQRTDGQRPLDAVQWYQRLAQRVMHWLDTLSRSGRLYEVDTRLRPDGSKGLLVTSIEAFTTYQRERAWAWEHQALLRARSVAGDPGLRAKLEQARRDILGRPRVAADVCAQVAAMRQRWRRQRDRSDTERLDLKQGPGALLDIEFLLQGQVLAHAADHPALRTSTGSSSLIRACRDVGVLSPGQARTLTRAHDALLSRSLACTLDARPRVAPRDAALAGIAESVLGVARDLGYPFAGDVATTGAAENPPPA